MPFQFPRLFGIMSGHLYLLFDWFLSPMSML